MSRRGGNEQSIVDLAAQVASRIDKVVATLAAAAAEAPRSGADFEHFVDATRQLLSDGDPGLALAGAGYAVEYVDSARAPAMVWWVRRGQAIAERTHSVDPDSESFYDYASLRWFRTARDSAAPTLSGPFIDTWGSDDYTVTVSQPVTGDSRLLGVIAADVEVRRFIDSLTADLRRISAPLTLVNEADRVVVSTVPSLSTGLPIRPRSERGQADPPSLRRYPVSDYGWSVVSFGA
ncbi:cache domain-containing protein [Mycobacterium sp. WMMD1722]|uniref:cache domain-containing protein n=1 Tax=Mycobacterium sp. WMMD1722 TaxID=3404117 RepID=UPI003BF5919B